MHFLGTSRHPAVVQATLPASGPRIDAAPPLPSASSPFVDCLLSRPAGLISEQTRTTVSDMRARSKPGASGRQVGLPPMTRAVVTLFHSLLNRRVLRVELEAIDDIRAGRASYGEVNFFWRTATLAWFLLLPVGFGVALLLGRTIPAILPATVPILGRLPLIYYLADHARSRTPVIRRPLVCPT